MAELIPAAPRPAARLPASRCGLAAAAPLRSAPRSAPLPAVPRPRALAGAGSGSGSGSGSFCSPPAARLRGGHGTAEGGGRSPPGPGPGSPPPGRQLPASRACGGAAGSRLPGPRRRRLVARSQAGGRPRRPGRAALRDPTESCYRGNAATLCSHTLMIPQFYPKSEFVL
eukprot:XP_027300479.1 thyrotropin subunit beta isoform X1 [Anas platyrhynchos]